MNLSVQVQKRLARLAADGMMEGSPELGIRVGSSDRGDVEGYMDVWGLLYAFHSSPEP